MEKYAVLRDWALKPTLKAESTKSLQQSLDYTNGTDHMEKRFLKNVLFSMDNGAKYSYEVASKS